MQVGSFNTLTNLFCEEPILPKQLVSLILEEMDLKDLSILNKVCKAWNYQVSQFPAMQYLQSFRDFPRWIQVKYNGSGCGNEPPSLDNYQIEESQQIHFYEILDKFVDVDDDEAVHASYYNPQLMARVNKLVYEANYRIVFPLTCQIGANHEIQLVKMDHNITDGEISRLTSMKEQPVKFSPPSENLFSCCLHLIFENVTGYNREIGQEKEGYRMMLRLKDIIVVSAGNKMQTHILKRTAEMFRQVCHKLNHSEDELFFSLLPNIPTPAE